MAFPAFFDTCVLYGSRLNDVILRLADRGAFRPLWSKDVLEELERNLARNGEDSGLIRKRIDTMTAYFADAMVEGYEHLVDGMLCDPKDRHVLAAAVRANAEVLVTFNLKDFPESSTEPFDVEVVHPDDFLLDQLDLFPGAVVDVLEQLVSVYDRPRVSIEDLLRSLAKAGVPKFANEVERFI
ncbi:PIN domain-containing protein [Galbitalea soli]|uniref:PIN domain-containing protein n=1 Tax=Galbitalea soli TaxID=1268042 RepID=A0A7C9PPA0_9MICO|nr:PIN domain-containing protein [Galbitalea soli]NYJ32083.1 putative nucleic acid-binding protein [Galbitalea soli]